MIKIKNINDSFELDIYNLTANPTIQTYNEVLDGKRKVLPKGTWESDENCTMIMRYALEVKLKLTKEQIPLITKQVISDNKLWGALNRFKSIRKLIHFVYPNKYNEFDFHRVPKQYWSKKENIKNRLEVLLVQNGYTVNDIPSIITSELLTKWGFSNPLKRWGNSPFKLIDALYPGQFTYTDFRSVPQGFSKNKDLLREQFMKMLKMEGINFEDTPRLVTQEILLRHRLSSALKYYNGSPSKMIIALFPDKFNITEFSRPNNYWKNKTNCKTSIEELIKEHKIPHDKIPKYITKPFLKDNGLSGLLHVYHGSPIEIITTLYPGEFDVTDFQRVPNKYWLSKENRVLALRTFCKKRNINKDTLPQLNHAYFKNNFPRFISMVERHYDSKYYLWILDSFPEYEFKMEDFHLFIGKDKQMCDSKEELTLHNYLLENIIQGKIVREGQKFKNLLHNETYIPDWIIYQGGTKYIVEYFGLYHSTKYPGYTEKTNRKMEYFRSMFGTNFIPIFPKDFSNIVSLLLTSGIKLK